MQDREYNVPLRIGTLFVVLGTSAIGVFAPMLLVKLPFRTINTMTCTGIKQFGTGIIIATAFVHVSLIFPGTWNGADDVALHTRQPDVHK